MHNAHITIEGKKISKSLGNTLYLHNLVDSGLSPRSLRYWFLTGHYRTPMNFTWEAIGGANAALGRLTRAYHEMPKGGRADAKYVKEFYAKIAIDLDTPGALAFMWNLIKDGNVELVTKRATLDEMDKILGLGLGEKHPRMQLKISQEELPKNIRDMMREREAARSEKDFVKSDALRIKIEEHGFEIKDTPEGPKCYPLSIHLST